LSFSSACSSEARRRAALSSARKSSVGRDGARSHSASSRPRSVSLGIGAAEAAMVLGLDVPDRMKIVAFSDSDAFPGVQLTALQLDPATAAKAAVNLLIDLIEGEDVEQRTLDVPVRLVRRDST
jgi:hypothetical protein